MLDDIGSDLPVNEIKSKKKKESEEKQIGVDLRDKAMGTLKQSK